MAKFKRTKDFEGQTLPEAEEGEKPEISREVVLKLRIKVKGDMTPEVAEKLAVTTVTLKEGVESVEIISVLNLGSQRCR